LSRGLGWESRQIQIEDKPRPAKEALRYVLERMNHDGGYTFCRGAPSNAQDTYYALEIYKALGVHPPRASLTARWLESFPAKTMYGYFYVCMGLSLIGRDTDPSIAEKVLSLRRRHGGFGDVEVDVEAYSEFESTYMATQVLRELDEPFDPQPTIEWLLQYKNPDGGFGAHGRSTLISTYHAVAALEAMGYDVASIRDVERFVRMCEKPCGGFTSVLELSLPYMQDVYSGIRVLGYLGKNPRNPRGTVGLILGMQNSNGGFRRSIDLGISTLEDTFYAVDGLVRLGAL